MAKSRFDTRTLHEVMGDLVSERTNPGDSITLVTTYEGQKRPKVTIKFYTNDPIKSELDQEEDISGWLRSSLSTQVYDDATGAPIEQGSYTGFSSWSDYIGIEVVPLVRSICNTGGRNFNFEDNSMKNIYRSASDE